MRILMINKYLYPKGGAENHMLSLGRGLADLGHDVQYFGMDHPRRCVGNRAGAYTKAMDFHGGSRWQKLGYGMRILYSGEARRKLRQVLDDFQPEVCHLHNFHYQLTPSILLEIRKWERDMGNRVKVLYTAHDFQLLCPNHMLRNPGTREDCEKCLGGHYGNCLKGRCIHGSFPRSLMGAAEAAFWRKMDVYARIDHILCPSSYMKSMLDREPRLSDKTVLLRNFVEAAGTPEQAGEYVLYFGRFSEEKGIRTLLQVCESLPQIPFVFAGEGPLEEELAGLKNVGFQQGGALRRWIQGARLTVCPSEVRENAPLSVMESLALGVPVVGADIGGIPELIQDGVTGVLFESGDPQALRAAVLRLWEAPEEYRKNCAAVRFDTKDEYCERFLALCREK